MLGFHITLLMVVGPFYTGRKVELNKEKATWKKSFEKSKKEYQEEAVAKV
jgi:hypothetical protein